MGTAVLLRTLQSYEPHVMYWVWHVPSSGHDRCVVDHPQHDSGRYLLCNVRGPCHCVNPISRLISTAVPGEGEPRLLFLLMVAFSYLIVKRSVRPGRTSACPEHKAYFYLFSPKLNFIDLCTGNKLTHTPLVMLVLL